MRAGGWVAIYRRVGQVWAALALVLFCSSLQGAKYLTLDGGAYVDNVAQRLNAPAGYASEVSSLTGYFRLRRAVAIGKSNWAFEPALAMLFPWRSGRDGFEKAFTFQLNLDLTYDLFRFLTLRAGPGIEYLMIVSIDERVPLNNGSSTTTSTFYVPGGVSNGFQFNWGVGWELRLFSRVSLNADFWATQIASSKRRRYQAALSLGFKL